eukprot:COSAG02_NODE_8938_length_2393_cov_1.926765_1_plen_644_part_01
MDGLEAWGSGGGALSAEVMDADACSWLEGHGVFDPALEGTLRENLVETVGDLAFLAGTESALGRLGIEAMTAVDVWDHLKPIVEALGEDEVATAPAPAPKSIFARKRQARASEASAETDLGAGIGDWLAEVGASECESAFRENMVETLGDVTFLVNSRSDLTAMGLSSAQAGRLWDHVATLSSSSGSAGSAEAAYPSADPDEDVSTWLTANGASDCERAMREAMVETVGDMLFLVNSKAVLADMGLSNLQVETVWGALKDTRTGSSSPTATSADDDLDAGILAQDAAEWLADRGQGSAEAVLRENMIETVADLTFLISSQSDMAKLGFAPVAQQDLWPDIEKLSVIADVPTPTARDDDEDMFLEEAFLDDDPDGPEEPVEPEEKPAKTKGGKKKGPPQATGDYKADVGGKNDPRLGWGALAGGADDTPKKKKGGKKKSSAKADEKKAAAAAEKAAKEQAKKEEAKAKREAQKAAEQEKKVKAMEARKKKKAAAEEKKKQRAEAKKKASAKAAETATSPKPSPKKKKVKGVSDRLSQPNSRAVGNETPKSEAEMSPKPRRGKAKPPRCATEPLRAKDDDPAAEFSPQLDWAVQRKLLDKIEQETRRREHLQWLKEKKQKEEDDAAAERRELQATYNFELHGPPKL